MGQINIECQDINHKYIVNIKFKRFDVMRSKIHRRIDRIILKITKEYIYIYIY